VCCETGDDEKNNKYGYARVLKNVNNIGDGLIKNSEAFSTSLIKSDSRPLSPKLSKKVRITEENFEGMIESRFSNFVEGIKSS